MDSEGWLANTYYGKPTYTRGREHVLRLGYADNILAHGDNGVIQRPDEDRLKDPDLGSMMILPGGITLDEYDRGSVSIKDESNWGANKKLYLAQFNKKDVDPLRVHIYAGKSLLETDKLTDRLIKAVGSGDDTVQGYDLVKHYTPDQLQLFKAFQLYSTGVRHAPR
jgi:hypothetical protein